MTSTLTRRDPATTAGVLALPLSMALWTVVLTVTIGMAPLDAAFSSDDGAYGIQVRSLADDGEWTLDRPVAVVPVENEGLVNGWRTEAGPVAYPNHPIYVQLLRAGSAVAGDTLGLRLVVFVGALVLPLLAWKLAEELNAGWPLGAFWLAALSPVVVHSAGLWAHAPSAALAGTSLLVAGRARHRPVTVSDTAIVAVALAAGVLLRREMLLWSVALAIGWIALRWSRRTVVAAGAAIAVVAATVVGEQAVQSRLAGEPLASAVAGNDPEPWLTGQLGAAWHGLLAPSHVGGPVGLVAMLGAVLVIAGAVRTRRLGLDAGRALLLAGTVLVAVRVAIGDAELTTGIVTAWPLAVAGVIVGWTDDRPFRFLAGVVGLFVVAVLATQHPDGGGLEWGGRYFSPAIVAVAVLASGGLHRLLRSGRAMRVSVVLALALPTLAGVLAADRIRERNAEIVDYVDQLGTPVVISDQPALPRVAWPTVPATAWYRATPDDLDPLLDLMADAHVQTLTLQGFGELDVRHTDYDVGEAAPGLRRLTLR